MRYSWLLCGLFALMGCGDGLNVVPVSGVVTLGGKPLSGAGIKTQPVGQGTRTPGPGSFGRTDAQGHFELELVKPARKGAMVGPHRVMIFQPIEEADRKGPQKSADGSYEFWTDAPRPRPTTATVNWPTRFTDGSLSMEVPQGGTDQIRLDLDATK
jgi:hypothetical protein